MKYYKKVFISAVIVVISIAIAYSVEAYEGLSEINGKVIRLHVLANSDSTEDQELKYKVRNKIITTFNEEFKGTRSKVESSSIIVKKIDQIRREAQEIIKEEGYNYEVDVYYGNYKFPRKMYEEIVLPEGYYDAVRIEIGAAQGNNWWCVMFPPLCFVDFGKGKEEPIFTIETEEKLQQILSAKEIEVIKTKRGIENIKLKSKVFEFIEKGKVEKTPSTYAASLYKGVSGTVLFD